jgi:hypothetical protein
VEIVYCTSLNVASSVHNTWHRKSHSSVICLEAIDRTRGKGFFPLSVDHIQVVHKRNAAVSHTRTDERFVSYVTQQFQLVDLQVQHLTLRPNSARSVCCVNVCRWHECTFSPQTVFCRCKCMSVSNLDIYEYAGIPLMEL